MTGQTVGPPMGDWRRSPARATVAPSAMTVAGPSRGSPASAQHSAGGRGGAWGAHFVPPLPNEPVRSCAGPFEELTGTGCNPVADQICVKGRLATADGALTMAADDRQTPFAGDCSYHFGPDVAAAPGQWLDFHDTASGPATYTFKSTPAHVLSWNPDDWGTPDALVLGYNRVIRLEVPAWTGACPAMSISMGWAFEVASSADTCPGWQLTVPTPTPGYPDNGSGRVYVQYGSESWVEAVLPVDPSGASMTGTFASSLPLLLPVTAASQVLAPGATAWKPAIRVNGAGAPTPTRCTAAVPDPNSPDGQHVYTATPSGKTCTFSIPAAGLTDPVNGAAYQVWFTAELPDVDGNPVDPMGMTITPRIGGAPDKASLETVAGAGATLLGTGSPDPNAMSTVMTVTAGATSAMTAALATVTSGADVCRASRARRASDAAGPLPPVYATCVLPPGQYTATAVVTAASGETSTTQAPFTVAVTAVPTVTAPKATFRTGLPLSGSSARLRLTWTGADYAGGAGIARYVLQQSRDGGLAWTTLYTGLTSAAANVTAPSSGTVRYRVRAINKAGTLGPWAYTSTLTVRLAQDPSGAFRWSSGWSAATSWRYSGGSAKWSLTKGAAVSATISCQAVSLVSTVGPQRGQAKIYVDGVYATTVNLYSATGFTFRSVVWQKRWSASGSHTIKVVVVGTYGHPRIDLDALAVIK